MRTGTGSTQLGLLFLCCAGCQPAFNNPTPPETATLEAAFDSPSGELDGSKLKAALDDFASQKRTIDQTDGLALLSDLVGETSNPANGVVKNSTPLDSTAGARLLLVANVTHICRGPEGEEAVDAKRFGLVRMTLKGTPRGIVPVAWGTFEDCVDHSSTGADITINGDYVVALRNADILFSFNGTIESGDDQFEGRLDFRVRDDDTIEVRVKSTDGDVVFAANPRGDASARDRNNVWSCSLDGLSCSTSTGEVISAEPTQ